MNPSLRHRLNALSQRRRGFRMSLVDVGAILICLGGTIALKESLGEMIYVAPIALGHFFLFCNVFRLRRSYELIWAGAFVCNVAAWSIFGDISWWPILAVQTPLTILLLILECRSPRYHGIFCTPEEG